MQLSTKGRYAVMAMTDLAGRCAERAVPVSEIAARQQISQAYLEQIFNRLRRRGIVTAHRGPGGGYRLARSAAETSVADVVIAVDEPLRAIRCGGGKTGCMKDGARCLTHDLWEETGRQLRNPIFKPASRSRTWRAARLRRPAARRRPAGTFISTTTRDGEGPPRGDGRGGAGAGDRRQSVVGARGLAAPARSIVEAARSDVGRLVGAKPESVVFVSGGTEANALAIERATQAGVERIIVGAYGARCGTVLENARATGVALDEWPVDANGVADLRWLANALADEAEKTLVCLMLANNETGVIQPVADAAELVRAGGGWLHVDAVQAAGKIAIDFGALGAETLALSAHKIGGPQGVGALVGGPRSVLSRQLHGGGQERGRRAGTENTPGIAGFGAAAAMALHDLPMVVEQADWRDGLAAGLKRAGVVALGEGARLACHRRSASARRASPPNCR